MGHLFVVCSMRLPWSLDFFFPDGEEHKQKEGTPNGDGSPRVVARSRDRPIGGVSMEFGRKHLYGICKLLRFFVAFTFR